MTVLGIDVSKYQGDPPWQALYAEGVRFVFIKATEATGFIDPKFHKNVVDARDAGLLVGAYSFFWPSRDPIAQAQFFYEQLKDHSLDLPPVIDLEDMKGCDAGAVVRAAYRFVVEIERLTGLQAIVYSYPSFINALKPKDLSDKQTLAELARRDLWIAHYTKTSPWIPPPWTAWRFWQFDGDKGRVMPNGVDADYNWFAGDEEDLLRYCGKPINRPLRTLDAYRPTEVPQALDVVTKLSTET